jgi:general secretion pathway protein G
VKLPKFQDVGKIGPVPFKVLPAMHCPSRSPIRKQTRKPARRKADSGVTLIEMMIVLVIIGIVAALIVPNVIGRPDQARVAVAKTDLRTIAASLEMYRLDNRTYPTAAQGLDALTTRPTEQPVPINWADGGYLPSVPQDPWGQAYTYKVPGEAGPFELVSLGADSAPGGEGVDGDILYGAGQGE